MKKLATLFSILALSISCDRIDSPVLDTPSEEPSIPLTSITITSAFEQPSGTTKTSLGDGNMVLWSSDDSFDLLPVGSASSGVKDVLVATVDGQPQGLGIPVSSTSNHYVKYEGISVVVGGVDVTSSITSTRSNTSNSYSLGIYNSSSKYQYAAAGTVITGSINDDNNGGYTLPLVQSSKTASSFTESNAAVVTLTGIQYSTDNKTWTAVNENSTLRNGFGGKDTVTYEWQSRSGSTSIVKTSSTITSGAGTASASFNAEIAEGTTYYAFYPASSSNSLSDGSISFSLPSTQSYSVRSFANGANPAVGVLTNDGGDYSVAFKNICGVLKLRLKGSQVVSSIEVTDPTETHSLWGQGTMEINAIGEGYASVSGGSNKLTLDCGAGVQLSTSEATDFYLVVPVGSFSEGLEIAVNTSFGTATKATTVANTISRSVIKTMPAFSTDRLEFVTPEFNIENPTVQDIMANSYSVFTSGSSSYLSNSTYTTNRDNALLGSDPYRNDQPAVKTIKFTGTGTGTVMLATDKAFEEVVLEDVVDLGQGSYSFKNMVPGTTYYYQVSNGSETLTEGAFKTTGQLRMIKIDRSWNIRDLGGWTGWNGNKVKYEWIYRGGSIGGQSSSGETYYLTDDEYEELHRIGIRSHLDLRAMPGTGAWPSGTQKNGFSLGVTKLIDGDIQQITTDWCTLYSTENGAAVGNFAYIIKSLKAGRPVYFNCRTGADRTGTMGMVVLGILGCDEYTAGNNGNQIAIDYEMTSLGMDEDGTINYNTSGAIGSYSSRYANGIWTSGYNFFRTVRNFSSFYDSESRSTITLNNYQEKMYYYLNRYFYDNSVNTAGAVYISKSDIDWFVNFMLGTDDFVGPSWAKEYTDNSLEHVISVADSHELYHSSTYGSIGANLP